jgi:hypothetical protein
LIIGKLFKFERGNLCRGGYDKEHYRLKGCLSSKEETFLAADMIKSITSWKAVQVRKSKSVPRRT